MPEFKEGDVVTHEQKFSFPGTYTVTKVNSYTVNAVGEDSSRTFVFTQEYLTKVTPEPYVPQVGDRVRVTYEGAVTGLSGDYLALDGDSHLLPFAPKGGGVVELIEKAPEPPFSYPVGTVAVSRLAPRTPAVRTAEGWIPKEAWGYHRDETIRDNPHFSIVHEPPTS